MNTTSLDEWALFAWDSLLAAWIGGAGAKGEPPTGVENDDCDLVVVELLAQEDAPPQPGMGTGTSTGAAMYKEVTRVARPVKTSISQAIGECMRDVRGKVTWDVVPRAVVRVTLLSQRAVVVDGASGDWTPMHALRAVRAGDDGKQGRLLLPSRMHTTLTGGAAADAVAAALFGDGTRASNAPWGDVLIERYVAVDAAAPFEAYWRARLSRAALLRADLMAQGGGDGESAQTRLRARWDAQRRAIVENVDAPEAISASMLPRGRPTEEELPWDVGADDADDGGGDGGADDDAQDDLLLSGGGARRRTRLPSVPRVRSGRSKWTWMALGVAVVGMMWLRVRELSYDVQREEFEAGYALLGVAPYADLRECKKAFYRESQQWHPDRRPGCAECAERYSSITEAWQRIQDYAKGRLKLRTQKTRFDYIREAEEEAERMRQGRARKVRRVNNV